MINSLLLAVSIIAHEPGYYTSLANHLQRWLKSEQITASVTSPSAMNSTLAKERVAFLVGFDKPTAGELAALKAYRARGGKLVVFYSSSPELAALMGVKVLGYKASEYPGQWSKMRFVENRPQAFPATIQQTSTVLMRAMPVAGRGRVLASWEDRGGRTSGDVAWIVTDAGYWMTHVLLADGDEALKIQLVAAMVGSIEPGRWSLMAHRRREFEANAAVREYALQQVPRAGEIHAVWDHSGAGLYPGDWGKTMRMLAASHVTDIFVNVAGAGFAHYPSSVLPRSKLLQSEGDQLAKAIAAARGTGVRVHAWILCFNATRAGPDRLEVLKRRGWRLMSTKGKLTEYLNPAISAVRAQMIASIDEIVSRYAVDGIHLDFVRYGDDTVKPKNAAQVITGFVAEVRRHVRHPKWLTTAVYGKYPDCAISVAQEWPMWLDLGIVDYVVPMDYTESNVKFESYLRQHSASKSHARRTIAGIGVTANESRLDARKVINQINLSRRYGLAGNALFDLDTTLEKQILPFLRLGMW